MKKIRVYLTLLFSVVLSLGILYYTLDDKIYLFVGENQGNYEKKEILDAYEEQIEKIEYLQVDQGQGDYRRQTYQELLKEIEWTNHILWGIFLACLGMVGRDLGYILRIRTLTEHKLSWRGAFRAIMVWEFSSAISPGVVGGSGVAMFILNKEGIPLGRSTAIVFFTALLDNLFYLIAVPVLLLLLPNNQSMFPDLFQTKIFNSNFGVEEIFWLGYIVIALISVLLFLSLTFFPNLLKHFFKAIFRFEFLKKILEKSLEIAEDMRIAAKDIRSFPMNLWAKAFGLTCLSWISRYLVINAIIFAFVWDLTLKDHSSILSLQLVFWIILLITPTPGGSGVAELVFSKFLAPFFPNKIIGSIMAVVWRLISYYPYLLLGAIILPRWLGEKKTSSKVKK